MNLMRDLVNPKWMYLKGVLLLVILLCCCVLLLLEVPTWRAALLLTLVIWSSARLYYFMFYVLGRYIDPSYRFSGIGSALRYLLARSGSRGQKREDTRATTPPNNSLHRSPNSHAAERNRDVED